MHWRTFIVLAVLLIPARVRAESEKDPDAWAVTHLDHLTFALDDLRSSKAEVRRQGIGRLVFYQGDSVADGILLEHWFAEADHSNRMELLRGLLRNGTLSEERISGFRSSATRFAAAERDLRLKELADVLSPNSAGAADAEDGAADRRR